VIRIGCLHQSASKPVARARCKRRSHVFSMPLSIPAKPSYHAIREGGV
jgi:hypothetical protein